MKKLAAVFLTLLFASTASAQVISNPTTNARMDGMGVANWQIEDDFNVFINPAQLSNYKNVIYGELGTDPCSTAGVSNSGLGGTAGCGDSIINSGHNNRGVGAFGGLNMDVSYGGWGVYLGRPYSPTGPLNLMGSTPPVANRFDLFYALHGAPAGFYLSYASRSTESKGGGGPKVTDQASEINLGGGVLINNMLDAAINLGLPSSKTDDGAGTTTKGDAGVNISLLARHHMGLGGNSKLLTTGQILLGDASSKITAGGGTAKDKLTSTTVRLDTAVNSKPNPSTLLVAGIGVVSFSQKDKQTGASSDTDSRLQIPVNVGVEHQTFKSVKTRIGLTKNIYDTSVDKNCSPTSPDFPNEVCSAAGQKATTVSDGPATVSMGFGWAVADNLMLDAVINQDILFTGTYMVSGVPETLNSKLSATYRF